MPIIPGSPGPITTATTTGGTGTDTRSAATTATPFENPGAATHHGIATDAENAAATKKTIETHFAPYDDPIEQDLALIREIIDARKADPNTYADGANPFSIKYGVYNLRNPAVIGLLAEAHKAGVDVQILIEDHQLDPKKTWNTADEFLIEQGFEFSDTHHGLTEAQKKELDFIGIEGSGLMHLKTRIFSRPDPETGASIEKVLTGSMNPGDSAPNNDETLHLISEPRLVERYKSKYQSVLDGTKLKNVWDDGAATNVLFTPSAGGPHPADQILQLIDAEQEAIFISVFTLRNITSKKQQGSLLSKLKAAKARGVEVVVVTDRKMSDGIDSSGQPNGWDDHTEEKLQAAGIPVFECTNEAGPYNAMHSKSAIFGLSEPKIVTDCGNWTKAALGSKSKKAKNDESYLFIDSNKLDGGATGLRYLSNFLYLIRKDDKQQPATTPRAEALIGALMKHPSWPKVKVSFDAVAKTHWGQSVYITGDHPALGTWTKDGPGIKLNTTGGRYPTWASDTSIELPFGLSLEFKVVKRDEKGRVEWQGGANQLLVVDAGDLRNDADPGKREHQVHAHFKR